MKNSFTLSVESQPQQADVDFLISNLVCFNDSQAEKENWQHLFVLIRDAKQEICGGINGNTHWGWLFLSHLWVREDIRDQGFGSKLVKEAEKEALKRGCRHAYVDTFDFQALQFYESLGYEVFGKLEDFPPGHQRFYLQKNLLGLQK